MYWQKEGIRNGDAFTGSYHPVVRHFPLNAGFFVLPVFNLFPDRKKEHGWALLKGTCAPDQRIRIIMLI
jgi:hypothetical protein